RKVPLDEDFAYELSGRGTVGQCSLPDFAQGLQLNVTAVDPTAPTYLTVYPAGEEAPNASHVNIVPGSAPAPNAVTVRLSDDGRFNVYNRFGNVHALADVLGVWVTADSRYYTEPEIDAMLGAVLTPGEIADLDLDE